jgi:hypothetical protein
MAAGGLLVGSVALLALFPACSSSSAPDAVATTTTASSVTATSSPPVTVPDQNPTQIAACSATAKVVQTALAAYQAEKGSYPTPAPWSAATYASNYEMLTTSGGSGPFIAEAPPTSSYIIAFDAAGHVWVAPPGAYGPYSAGQDIDTHPDICDAAVG